MTGDCVTAYNFLHTHCPGSIQVTITDKLKKELPCLVVSHFTNGVSTPNYV